jgi:hypothetical protein
VSGEASTELTPEDWDAAGEAYRLHRAAGLRPLWADMLDYPKSAWIKNVSALDRALRRRGLCIAPLPPKAARDV